MLFSKINQLTGDSFVLAVIANYYQGKINFATAGFDLIRFGEGSAKGGFWGYFADISRGLTLAGSLGSIAKIMGLFGTASGEVAAVSEFAVAPKGTVALDANALIRGLEKGESVALQNAIAGRTPTISITAAKEFLKKGDVNVLRKFLKSQGGRVGKAATNQQIAELQSQAQLLGRVLKSKDASVVGSAINEGATVITRDARLQKFLNAAGLPVEGF